MASEGGAGSRGARGVATLATLLVLVALLCQWTGTELRARMAGIGEALWPAYAALLRSEPTPPGPPPSEPAAAEPTAKAAEGGDDDDLLDDLLEDVEGAKSEADVARERHEAELRAHAAAVKAYDDAIARRTATVRAFAAVDLALGEVVTWLGDHLRHLFILLLGIGGVIATAGRHHIALRPIRGRRADQVAQGASLLANLLLLASVVAQHQLRIAAGTDAAELGITALWVAAFGAMALVNLAHLRRPLADAGPREAGGLGGALLAAPLYATMAILAGVYFVAVEGYVAGLAVYLEKLLQNVQLYLQVGLYVWVGMILGRTRLAPRLFAALRPWRLPPELLAIVVVLAAAIPTAYSGASGIFVIAAGGLIFRELIAAGARPGLALASTAMSGSMGVVLSPCLLVVIIAYLSKGVSSDQLFEWGRLVFLLSALLFVALVLATRSGPLRPAPERGAGAASLAALRGLLPHALIFAGVLGLAYVALDVGLDVNSAAYLLPLALLPILAFDRRAVARAPGGGGGAGEGAQVRPPGEMTAFAATAEASVHIGALLLLMALSAGLGGVIERADVVALVPAAFASPLAAMAVLMVVLVVIGMVMDPYGAVILVQATLAGIASASGIDPVHFWMVVLVAFELGYLTPPVALNHLLARQVIGDDPALESGALPGSWWRRHERYALPIAVMATTLLLVAFGPLLVGGG